MRLWDCRSLGGCRLKPRLAPRLEGTLRREVEEIAGEVPPAEADPAAEIELVGFALPDGVPD